MSAKHDKTQMVMTSKTQRYFFNINRIFDSLPQRDCPQLWRRLAFWRSPQGFPSSRRPYKSSYGQLFGWWLMWNSGGKIDSRQGISRHSMTKTCLKVGSKKQNCCCNFASFRKSCRLGGIPLLRNLNIISWSTFKETMFQIKILSPLQFQVKNGIYF